MQAMARELGHTPPHYGAAHSMPLTAAPACAVLTVVACKGQDETRQHLASLGFVPGCTVRVVNEANGNFIIDVKGARIALDRRLATRILVQAP